MGERKRTSPVSVTLEYPKGKQKAVFCKQYGLNSIYAGKHWAQRKADKDYWYALVRHTLREQSIPPVMFGNPVEILFHWDDGLDCDNHAYMQKLIIDTLTGYLIRDDDKRFVKKVSSEFHDAGHILVEIREYGTA